MITEKDIKPIPKYISKLIFKEDFNEREHRNGKTRFYSYLAKYNKELVQVIVACKNRGKKWYHKQVAIHGIHTPYCLVKDMEYFWLGGYVVGWYNEGLNKTRKWYETDEWFEADDKYYFPFAHVVNREFALKFKEYKYSSIEKSYEQNIIKYLRLYEEYPQMELLVKFGLDNYAMSKTILKKVAKDKKFRKWLIANRNEISINSFYVDTIMTAYKLNKSLKETQEIMRDKKLFDRPDNYKSLKELISKNERYKFFSYLQKQQTNLSSYEDYIIACKYLRLNLNEEKHKYPKNFKKWHDIRIDQYRTAKIKEDKKQRKALYEKFANIADKYLTLERNKNENFVVIIARSPADLIKEGQILHHCVGQMNYDQKFIREESLIFFVRTKEDMQTPFITLEYSLKNHKVLQCYGEHDTKPSDDILDFVNKKWLPYANRKLRQIAI